MTEEKLKLFSCSGIVYRSRVIEGHWIDEPGGPLTSQPIVTIWQIAFSRLARSKEEAQDGADKYLLDQYPPDEKCYGHRAIVTEVPSDWYYIERDQDNA